MVWIDGADMVCRRSVSGTSTSANVPLGNPGWLISILLRRFPGFGNCRVNICRVMTPNEKQSIFSVYTGLSRTASGGINTSVPGHIVKVR